MYFQKAWCRTNPSNPILPKQFPPFGHGGSSIFLMPGSDVIKVLFVDREKISDFYWVPHPHSCTPPIPARQKLIAFLIWFGLPRLWHFMWSTPILLFLISPTHPIGSNICVSPPILLSYAVKTSHFTFIGRHETKVETLQYSCKFVLHKVSFCIQKTLLRPFCFHEDLILGYAVWREDWTMPNNSTWTLRWHYFCELR